MAEARTGDGRRPRLLLAPLLIALLLQNAAAMSKHLSVWAETGTERHACHPGGGG